jgi:hypothetical protein
MAEMDSRQEWVERELARAMAPVSAPEGLWAAIHRPREARRSPVWREFVFWPAMAVILLLVLAGALRSHTLDDAAMTAGAGSASNCHTPAYTIPAYSRYLTAAAAGRNAQESCLACHFSMPGTLLVSAPGAF